MIDNLELFRISAEYKEPYMDPFYVKDGKPVITENPNKLMQANEIIRKNISEYKKALDANDSAEQDNILDNIITALKVKGINSSEFVSYWAVKDMSHSLYKKAFKTDELKKDFLRNIIPEFIRDRHSLYEKYGYSPSTLQAISDSKAHKSNGSSANQKVTELFEKYGFSHFDSEDIAEFIPADRVFIHTDKEDKKLFKKILEHYKIEFSWSKKNQNKQPDFLFKVDDKIFIMEHKHKKEQGGGQNGQIGEIINLIGYGEVYYVSFMDGMYFNLLTDERIISGKTYEQRKSILENLAKNKKNYFVNTGGFTALLQNFI